MPPFKEESATPSKGIKRDRSSSPELNASQTSPAKRAKGQKKTAEEKAAKAKEKQAKADAKADEKKKKDFAKQVKKDWKDWTNANVTKQTFPRETDEDLINVKESGKVYGMKKDELDCLSSCPVPNPHGPFAPMKLYRQSDVQRLAFRRQAILGGVSQDDEEKLLRRGKELYEAEKGPVEKLYGEKMGDAVPAKVRGPPPKIKGRHWVLIKQLKAGQLMDSASMDAIEELEEAGLRHMVDRDWKE